MSIMLLSPTHELVAGTPDAESAEFASDPRHPGEEPKVLLLLDDHRSEPRTEIVPADPEVQDWLPSVTSQIRESTLLDAFEAVREVLVARGSTDLAAENVIEAARAIAEMPKIPEGWAPWGQVPRGSLSSLGDGRWLLIWPEMNGRGHDMALIEGAGDATPARVQGPERVYRPDRPVAPFVRVARAGLTSAQIEAFLGAEYPDTFSPEFMLGEMFLVAGAA